jgi:DNA polymerase III subunit delta
MMHALEWLRDAARQPVHPVYAVFGTDHYLVRESISAVSRSVFPDPAGEAAITRFPGTQAKLADVQDELFTLPFLSRRRLVIVEEADPFVTKHRKELEAYVERPSSTGILLLQVKQWTVTTNLAKRVDKLGLAIDCNAVPEKQAGKVVSWLIQYVQTRCDAQLEPAAANLLVELVGLEIGILASEVEKLAVYAGETKRIERADVARMVGAGRVETVWKALDAATTGHARTALELLDNLLAAGEMPVMLLAAMSASLVKIHHAGRLRRARLGLDEACRIAGINPYFASKTGEQHAHLGPRRVDQLPATLLRADLDLKGGSSAEPRVVLERLLVGLAQPRDD